jgi:N-acetylneuraminic acid mutarotase
VQENQWYEIRPIVAPPETMERRRQMYPDAEEPPAVTAKTEGNFPEARTDHTFVRYKNRFYVYGGRDEVQIFKDIHEYQILTNTWRQIFHHSNPRSDEVHRIMLSYEEESPTAMLDHVAFVSEPNIRFGHTAIVHKSLMYVFGGWDGTETLNHLNAFDLKKNVWLQFSGMKGSIKGRYRHSACATQSSMYIFGGIDQNQERFNDINQFNFDSQTWTRIVTSVNSPSQRTFHEALMFKGVMYVFGGFDGAKRNDIYRILFDEEERRRNLADYELK